MADDKRADLTPLKSALAVLVTCIVQTLNESDQSFETRFLERLALAYRERRDDPAVDLNELEALAWTRDLLTGFSFVSGEGKPFLKD